MTLILLVSASVIIALLNGLLSQDLFSCFIMSICAGVSLIVLRRDISIIGNAVDALLLEGGSRECRGMFQCATKWGAGVCSKIRLVHAATNFRTNSESPSPAEEILPEFSVESDYPGDEMFYMYTRIADFAARQFGACAAAVIVKDPEDDGRYTMYCSRKLRKKGIEDAILSYRNVACAGSRTMNRVDPQTFSGARLYLRGITYSYYSESNSEDLKDRICLFLGFARAPQSLPEDIDRFVASACHSLPNLVHLSRNSSRIFDQTLSKNADEHLLAHMSHDMRSPLNNIRSVLTLLKTEGAEAEKAEMLDIALSNCEAMDDLIGGILDLSAHSAGHLVAQADSFDVETLAHEVVRAFALAARMKGLDLTIESVQAPLNIRADRKQTKRILSNLVDNALKYTRFGFVRLSLTKNRHGMAVISVADSGPGIDQRELRKLFKPFVRLGTGEMDGLGLGLALSRILAELNKGKISVESAQGRGSRFTLCLPLESNTRVEVVTGKSKKVTDRRNEEASVLIVDDDPDCVESTARNLKCDALTVIKAYSLPQALQIINFERPDAIVTDDSMPGGGGIRLIEDVQKKWGRVPVAVLSGRRQMKHCLQKGASKIFLKPVDIEELREWILSAARKEESRISPPC